VQLTVQFAPRLCAPYLPQQLVFEMNGALFGVRQLRYHKPMSALGRPPLASHEPVPDRRSRAYWAASGAVLALYLGFAIGLSLTRIPICDEGWSTSPTLSLITNGGMGSPVLESAGTYLRGIEQYTYWIMPLHALIQAPWFHLFGATLFSTRMLSVAAGFVALFCWFYVIRSVTGDRAVALLSLALISIDSTVLILASTGRSDMLSAAFGAAALAAYLSLRENHFRWALFSAHAFAVASGLTHPIGGLIAVPSLVFLHFYFDGRRLRWPDLLPIAAPYLIGGVAWSAYILRSPEVFWAQFAGNSAGRLWPLKAPLAALQREFTDRFFPAYGLSPGANRVAKGRVMVLFLYAAAVLGLLGPRSLRRTQTAKVVGFLIAIVLFVLTFFEGAKQPWYLIHLTWLLAAAVAASYKWHAQARPSWRPVWIGMVAGLMLLETGYAVALIAGRKYATIYQPTIAALQRDLQPGQSVIGSAELGFGLGFDRVKDDASLGYYSGKRPDFIVIDGNYRAHLADLAHTRPVVYASLRNMLQTAYQPLYANALYTVYARTRKATP
jgi:4-amino-4-deoxy-L-arabinose transferase-like glycosyltransferase